MKMQVDGVKQVARRVTQDLSKNSPTILTGMAVAGVIATIYLTARATPKAILLLEQEEKIRGTGGASIGMKDKVVITWRECLPPALMGAATISCIIGANSIHLQRNAALLGVYALTESALKEYQAKVIQTLGEKKEQKIKDDIAQDRLLADPVSKNEIIFTGRGDSLCYDTLSGRYFKTDIEKLRRIENQLNHTLLTEMWVSLNDFYIEVGLAPVELGHEMGWNADQLIDLGFSSKLTDDEQPCLVITFLVTPVNYDTCSVCR